LGEFIAAPAGVTPAAPLRKSLFRSVAANLTGQIWSGAIQLLFIPVYLRLLGIESYALIGFYATLQATLQILDLGLSPTINRELARFTAFGQIGEARDFVLTLQFLYWGIGLLIGAALWMTAPLIAQNWIHTSSIPAATLTHAVRLMGVLSVFQWPVSFYSGGLMGLQCQSLFNGIKVVSSTLGNVGAAIVLYSVSRTISAFLTWQILVNALYVVLLALALWRQLATSGRSRWHWSLVKGVWRFAAGMTGIGMSAVLLTQLDKVILIKLLPLREFGYYSLATTATAALFIIISSIFNGLFPQFSALAAHRDEKSLRALYRRGTQLMAVGIIPAATVMAFYPDAFALAWTGDRILSGHIAPLIALLAIGTALNGMMNLPYALQLAYGWTRLGLSINAFLTAVLVPAILLLAPRYGAIGGAAVWIVLNLIYMGIGVPLTHRRVLRGEAAHWFLKDAGPIVVSTIMVAGLLRFVLRPADSRLEAVVLIVVAFLVSSILAALSASSLRSLLNIDLLKSHHGRKVEKGFS
jgi:O-antigen/teichoic acid export membrane protein